MEEEMEKKYSFLHKKFDDLQSKLTPIISDSLNSPSTPPLNSVSEKINNEIIFINKMINAELATKTNPDSNPTETRHLFNMIRRVQLLQKGLHALSSNARSTSSSVESYDPIMCSNIDSCLDQDHVYDRDDEESELDDHFNNGNYPRMRFKVYENPEFVGGYDEDVDGEMEFGGIVNEDVEEEEKCSSDDKDVGEGLERIVKDGSTIRGFQEKEEKKRDVEEDDSYDGDEDDTKTHCCVRIVFWGWVIFIVMGLVSLMSDSDIPDHHSSTVFLTPT